MHVAILFERQSDLMSAPQAVETTHYHWREPEEVEAIAAALTELGHQVTYLSPLDALLELWRDRPEALPDLVWNLSVRAQSRSRTALAPAVLEQLQIPYTGGDAAVKGLILNKDWLKPVLQWCGIATPPWLHYAPTLPVTELPPWSVSVLKPACEGYSLGLVTFDRAQGLNQLQKELYCLFKQLKPPLLPNR